MAKIKYVSIVLEGFLVLQVAYFVGGEYIARGLLRFDPNMPLLTAATIGSANISPIVAIIYMVLRVQGFPALIAGPNLVSGTIGGIMLSWFVTFVGLIAYEGTVLQVEEILRLPPLYKYHGIFSFVVWSPAVEELMARGFFFEILKRQWGILYSTIASTFLFVLAHALWADFGPGLSILALYSFTFTFAYVYSGLCGAVVSHIFVNGFLSYLTYLNA